MKGSALHLWQKAWVKEWNHINSVGILTPCLHRSRKVEAGWDFQKVFVASPHLLWAGAEQGHIHHPERIPHCVHSSLTKLLALMLCSKYWNTESFYTLHLMFILLVEVTLLRLVLPVQGHPWGSSWQHHQTFLGTVANSPCCVFS